MSIGGAQQVKVFEAERMGDMPGPAPKRLTLGLVSVALAPIAVCFVLQSSATKALYKKAFLLKRKRFLSIQGI